MAFEISGKSGSTRSRSAASWRVAPGGKDALLSKIRVSARRWTAIRAAIESEVVSQLRGRGAMRAARSPPEWARRGARESVRPPHRRERLEAIDGDRAGQEGREDHGREVHRPDRQPMRGLITQAMSPIELAHEVGGPAASGDQDGADRPRDPGSLFVQEIREAQGSSIQSSRLPPTLTTATEDRVTIVLDSTRDGRSDGERFRSGSNCSDASWTRAKAQPAEEAISPQALFRLTSGRSGPIRRRASREPGSRPIRRSRRPWAVRSWRHTARSAARVRRSIRQASAAAAKARASAGENPSRSAPIIRARRSAPRRVSRDGRRPWTDRSGWMGCRRG